MSFHTAILQEPSYVHTYMGEQPFAHRRTDIYNIFKGLQQVFKEMFKFYSQQGKTNT